MLGASPFWNSFFKGALDALYPPKCALCGQLHPEPVCESCLSEMVRSASLVHYHTKADLSFRGSIYPYEGRAAQAVRRLKYERATSLASFMAEELFSAASELGVENWTVAPVPVHWSRRFSRGFNQAELLCAAFPAVDFRLLRRVRATRQQVGLSREQRQRNLDNAFRVNGTVAGKRVLLVDDVLTTGQTALECARVLRQAGALDVGVLAFAGDE